jgi:hypothetical protein
MDKEWSLKDLITIAPFMGTSFAFAFVVGYFLAFDISWFPFFTLAEHVVFALRALPIALGASIAFVIVLNSQPDKTRSRAKKRLAVAWMALLVSGGVLAFFGSHFALWLSLWFMAFGTYVHHRVEPPRPFHTSVLYWATTMMLISLIIGYGSGHAGKLAWQIDKTIGIHLFPLTPSICIRFADTKGTRPPELGQIVFAGGSAVLFYEYPTQTTHLYRIEKISEIDETNPSPFKSTKEPPSCLPAGPANANNSEGTQ